MWALIPLLAIPPGFRSGIGRPDLSGPAEHVERDGFRVWFTRDGKDAPSPADEDGNLFPDLVDATLDALVAAAPAFVADGWRPLAPDDGAGGSDAIDAYVLAIGANGYAIPWTAADGSTSCFLELDPTLPVAGGIAASVAVHELHHCVQFRYTTAAASWLYEAAATTEQYVRVRDVTLDYALGVLWVDRLGRPDAPLDAVDGRLEYGAFVWMKYWWERDGAEYARLPALWEALAAEPDWTKALDREARRLWDEDLGDTFLEHAVWNAFACSADDGRHYRDDPLPCIADVEVPTEAWDGGDVTVSLPEAWTAAYLDGPPDRLLRCDGDGVRTRTVDGRATVVAIDGPVEATCSGIDRAVKPATAVPIGCRHAGGAGLGALFALLAVRRRVSAPPPGSR